MLLRVRICELFFASLLEAPPNVNKKTTSYKPLQNAMTKKKGKATKMEERSRYQNDELKEKIRIS